MSNTKYYFAYGANTNIDNMGYRCPQAINLGKLILPDYRLVFRGVADIERYKSGSSVEGVLWEITEDWERALDIFEGFPHLYRKELFTAQNKSNGEVMDIMYYKMNSNDLSKPTAGYYSTIYQGYKDNGLDIKFLNQAVKIS